ncbi:MAG: hypothetical protein L0Y72_00235, partial [Gemmataceae bacterium]|nr:hypothetical protein [Gemmataceae bacterium]
ATCYKAVRTDLLRALDLQAQRFEFCPEVTAKLCRLGIPILEVPISYEPRTSAQGKKIGLVDAWQAAWTLVRWRFQKLPSGNFAALALLSQASAVRFPAALTYQDFLELPFSLSQKMT